MTLPLLYADAAVRCVLPLCPKRGRLGLGIDLDGLPKVRVALTREDARFLVSALQDYLSRGAGSQSPMSRLSPISSSSVPSEGLKV